MLQYKCVYSMNTGTQMNSTLHSVSWVGLQLSYIMVINNTADKNVTPFDIEFLKYYISQDKCSIFLACFFNKKQ